MSIVNIKEKIKSALVSLKQRRNTFLTLLFLLMLPVTLLAVRYQQNLSSQASQTDGRDMFAEDIVSGQRIIDNRTENDFVRLKIVFPDWSKQAQVLENTSQHIAQSSSKQSVLQASTGPGCADSRGFINGDSGRVCTEWVEGNDASYCYPGTTGTNASNINSHYFSSCPLGQSSAASSGDKFQPIQTKGYSCADSRGWINGDSSKACTSTSWVESGAKDNEYCYPGTKGVNASAVNSHYFSSCPTSSGDGSAVSLRAAEKGKGCSIDDATTCGPVADLLGEPLYCRQFDSETPTWVTQATAISKCAQHQVSMAYSSCSPSTYKCNEDGEWVVTSGSARQFAVGDCCNASAQCGGGTCDTQTTSTVPGTASFQCRQRGFAGFCSTVGASGGSQPGGGFGGVPQPTATPRPADPTQPTGTVPGSVQWGNTCDKTIDCEGNLVCAAEYGTGGGRAICIKLGQIDSDRDACKSSLECKTSDEDVCVSPEGSTLQCQNRDRVPGELRARGKHCVDNTNLCTKENNNVTCLDWRGHYTGNGQQDKLCMASYQVKEGQFCYDSQECQLGLECRITSESKNFGICTRPEDNRITAFTAIVSIRNQFGNFDKSYNTNAGQQELIVPSVQLFPGQNIFTVKYVSNNGGTRETILTINKPESRDYVKWLSMMQSLGIYPAREGLDIVLYNRDTFVAKYCPSGCVMNPPTPLEVLNGVKQQDDAFFRELMVKLDNDTYATFEVLQDYFPSVIDTPQYKAYIAGGRSYRDSAGVTRIYPIEKQKLIEFIQQIYNERGMRSNTNIISTFIGVTDPIFGTRAAIDLITISPNQLTDEDRINGLMALTLLPGLGERVVFKGFKLTGNTIVDLPRLIKNWKIVRGSIDEGVKVTTEGIGQTMFTTISNQADDLPKILGISEALAAAPPSQLPFLRERVAESSLNLFKAFPEPDKKFRVFSLEGSSGVVYANRPSPIVYKVTVRRSRYNRDPQGALIADIRYTEAEAKKLMIFSQEGMFPRLIEYVKPKLNSSDEALLRNSAFDRVSYQNHPELNAISLPVSNRQSDLPIIVMDRIDIDPQGISKLAAQPQRVRQEIERITDMFDKHRFTPGDTEVVVDMQGKIMFVDAGGIIPINPDSVIKTREQIREAVEHIFREFHLL